MTQMGWTFDPANPVFQKREERPRRPRTQGRMVQAYLWSRTILCRACLGLIPLSPQWNVSRNQGLRLVPEPDWGIVRFELVGANSISRGSIKKGIATCPLCGATTPKGYPADEAQAGRMGHIEYCRVYRGRLFPIFHRDGRQTQGRDPIEYEVPGNVLWESVQERARVLKSAGLAGAAAKLDPLLLDLGLFGGTESHFAPGVERLGVV